MKLIDYMQEKKAEIEVVLDQVLPKSGIRPSILHESMRYSTLGGGKRLRAILAMAACEAVGGDPKQAHGLAAALEMIHAYSLVHDDLPCMDDDDLRRGKPTNHKVFGESVAVLAGDGLLTEAFAELARMPEKFNVSHEITVRIISEVAFSSGSQGMVGGQVEDILSMGEGSNDADQLEFIHTHKTGALFRASLRCGAILGQASSNELNKITEYADSFGLAFQITDDILDETGEAASLGKAVGVDERLGKLTYPRIYGLEKSKEMASACVARCHQALRGFSDSAWPLREMAEFIIHRDH